MSACFASPATGLYPVLFGGETPRVVALVGGGGKTSAINTLAAELSQAGHTVIITTTTKMRPPEEPGLFAGTVARAAALLARQPVIWAGTLYAQGKMKGIPGAVPALAALADYLLIEADGARKRPLKMTDKSHEPVVPPEAEAVVAVAGMDGIGKPVSEAVHRPELAHAALDLAPEHIVTPPDVARLLTYCYAPRFVLLNKAETPQAVNRAQAVAAGLPAARCVITSLQAWGLTERR